MKKYTKTHEWVSVRRRHRDGRYFGSCPDHLGDVVYMETYQAGKSLKKGDVLCTINLLRLQATCTHP